MKRPDLLDVAAILGVAAVTVAAIVAEVFGGGSC